LVLVRQGTYPHPPWEELQTTAHGHSSRDLARKHFCAPQRGESELVAAMHHLRRGMSSVQQFKVLIQTQEAPTEGKAYFNEDLLPTPPSLWSPTSSHLL
jgi:hypothetical protein